MKFASLFKSWKTTAVGIVGGGILLLTSINDMLSSDQVEALAAAVVAFIGILAKDGDKSSQDVGIRPE